MTRRVQCVLWTAVLLTWPCLALAQVSYDFDAAAGDVAGQLAQRFPHLQGEVVDVQGAQLYLSLGARDQVLEGMRLNVFREGEALTSPTTGEVLGRLEEDLGTVTVAQVAETYAVAVLADPAGEATVRAGDKVRITAGRLSLGLLPINDQTGGATPLAALSDAMRRGLDATGRFHVAPRARLTIWLLERGLSPGDVLDPAFTSAAADAMGAVYIAQPVLRERRRDDSCRASFVCTRSAADAGDHSPGRAFRSRADARGACLAPRPSASRRRCHAADPSRFAACRGGSDARDTGGRSNDAAKPAERRRAGA